MSLFINFNSNKNFRELFPSGWAFELLNKIANLNKTVFKSFKPLRMFWRTLDLASVNSSEMEQKDDISKLFLLSSSNLSYVRDIFENFVFEIVAKISIHFINIDENYE